jgi:beta-lactamase regulating signal transducer with metallopeptidase domain
VITELANHLWQSTLFVIAAWLLTLVLRNNGAHARYWLWFAASLKFLVPFSLLSILGSRLVPQVDVPEIFPPFPELAEQVAAPFSAAMPALSAHVATGRNISTIILAVWGLGFATVLLLWFIRWTRINALLRSAKPLPLAAPVPVKSSHSSLEPGLVGIWNPVLLLPEELRTRLSSEETRSILAHELAHLRRRDNLTFAIHMLIEALFWFYPPIWWLGARLIEERERACDESVLASDIDAEVYAQSILKVCRFYLRSPLPCAAGVSGADLKKRIEAIMDGHPTLRVNAAQKLLITMIGAAGVFIPILFGVLTLPTANAVVLPEPVFITQAALAQRRDEQSKHRTAVAFDPGQFDKYIGYYKLDSFTVFHIFRSEDQYFTQQNRLPPDEVYPESDIKFFSKDVAKQFSFVTNARGQVVELILHQGGHERPMMKVDKSEAERMQATIEQRIKNHAPSPGTEASLRRYIDSLQKGQPNYDEMSPTRAATERRELPIILPIVQKAGAFKSLTFKEVGEDGLDVYDATFEHAHFEWYIAPLSADGKVVGRGFQELP